MAIKIQGNTVIYDDQVFRPAQLTTAQRNNIASPQVGMLIYNTESAAFEVYSGTAWAAVGGGGADELARTLATLAL